MARRSAEQPSLATSMLQSITNTADGAMPFDERLAQLASMRDGGVENAAAIDRFLMEQIAMQQGALSTVQEQHARLHQLIRSLTEPPYYLATFIATASAPDVRGAMVQIGDERRVVQLGEGIAQDQLTPGDEVYLSHERNFVIAKAPGPSFLTGEVAAFSRTTPDGRFILQSRDEELVVRANETLRSAGLKAGDAVRFSRATGMALEKIEASKGKHFFLESTPSDTFQEIGGLDRQIEQLKRQLTMHIFHPDLAGRYKVPPRRSALFEGPPGNGKTKLARATANWLATLSPGGSARFISVKPGALGSMWHSKSEENVREIFRIAREATMAEPGALCVMFFDEIDAIGSQRGESINRIDDKILNAFMAELDGLEDRGRIVILGATNRMHTIDTALLRPRRLGDLVLQFPQPGAKASRAILARHMPADIPYASKVHGPDVAREELLDQAVAQLFAQSSDTELANLTLRDGKHRMVRAADLVSGAYLESMAQSALERACVREAEGGPAGVTAMDMSAAIFDFFAAAPRALTPHNARSYFRDLPQDVDVVRVDLVERKVKNPYRYRVEAA